jgi:hypothetical protein
VIFDAVLSAVKSLYLLRAQLDVDTSRIGVVGVLCCYMTTMVGGLAGDEVRAGFALYGCVFLIEEAPKGRRHKIRNCPATAAGECLRMSANPG